MRMLPTLLLHDRLAGGQRGLGPPYRRPSSLILPTSPATTSSVEPERISARSPFGGGATFWILIFAALAPTWPATPRSAAVFTSSGFFFAAMMPLRDA